MSLTFAFTGCLYASISHSATITKMPQVPIDLQFATFSLVCMFYAFLVYERMWLHVRHFYRIMYALANGTVLALTTGILAPGRAALASFDEVSLVYIILSWKHGVDPSSDLEKTHHLFMSLQFLILVITYAYYGVRLMLASSSPDVSVSSAPGMLGN